MPLDPNSEAAVKAHPIMPIITFRRPYPNPNKATQEDLWRMLDKFTRSFLGNSNQILADLVREGKVQADFNRILMKELRNMKYIELPK